MNILLLWLLNSLAVLLGAYILPWVTVSGFSTALLVALVLGLVNMVFKPILLLLTLPINILTLGLFTFVINALLLMFTDKLISGFNVGGFVSALLLSLIVAIVNGAFTKA